jgi:hypothetical protein
VTYEELAELLSGLPWGENGVPRPLATVLVPPRQRQRRIAGEPPGRLEFLLLAALGLSGWSARVDLVQALNAGRGLQPRSGSYRRAVSRLDESGLWVTLLASFGYRQIALVRLSERGAELLQETGVAVVASEWERAELAHALRGDAGRSGVQSMTPHTAAICTFLHHARLRGYTTEPCPAVEDGGPTAPDAAIARFGLALNIEVQRHGGETHRKAQKWRNLERLQGFVALCAVTPAWAIRLARQAQDQGVARGAATDLGTLASRAPASLWTYRWRSPYSPLEAVAEDGPEAEWLLGERVHVAGVPDTVVDVYTWERSR